MSLSKIAFDLPDEEPQSKKMAGMKPFHEDLFEVPFFVGVIGPRHSGKSVWLFNLLSKKPGMYGASFKDHNIIVYSPTKDKDPTLKQLKLKYMYGPETDFGWLVHEIQKTQKANYKADNMTGVLLVIDDCTQLKGAWPHIETLSFYGRHDHIQVMYVAHKMSSIPRSVRTQTQQWTLFEPHERSELDWLLDMFSDKQTRVVWQNALRRCWDIPYNFAIIDYEQKELDRKYRSGFHEPLFTPDELNLVTGQVPLSTREMNMMEQVKGVNEERQEPIQEEQKMSKKRKRRHPKS